MTMKELADFRKRMGITQVQVADEMGVSKGYINNLEKGNGKNATASDDEKKRYSKAIRDIQIKKVKGEQKPPKEPEQVEQKEVKPKKKAKKKAKVQEG